MGISTGPPANPQAANLQAVNPQSTNPQAASSQAAGTRAPINQVPSMNSTNMIHQNPGNPLIGIIPSSGSHSSAQPKKRGLDEYAEDVNHLEGYQNTSSHKKSRNFDKVPEGRVSPFRDLKDKSSPFVQQPPPRLGMGSFDVNGSGLQNHNGMQQQHSQHSQIQDQIQNHMTNISRAIGPSSLLLDLEKSWNASRAKGKSSSSNVVQPPAPAGNDC